MFELHNTTNFSAEPAILQDFSGARHLLVVVRASFIIVAGGLAEIAEADEVVQDIKYNGEPGQSSVKYESDFSLEKTATDVIVIGQAYGNGARSADVSLVMGPVRKCLRVHGDRYWDGVFGTEMTEAARFDTMPLVYERGFGGSELVDGQLRAWEPRNPVGRGFATKASKLVGQLGPNIEYPNEPIRSCSGRSRPAGFGVIGRHWHPRASYAGTYDAKWERERFPLLPEDYDPQFAQVAPEDQQVPGYLRGDEAVELTNMTENGYWAFPLPRVHLAFTTRIGREDVEHRARLHTVILEPDRALCSLVWCTSLRCHGKEYKLGHITVREKEVLRTRTSVPV